jgi:hypothetical protein
MVKICRRSVHVVVKMELCFNINNGDGFYCRKQYRLLKRHKNSTLSAISRRDIITWTLSSELAFHCQNSRNCWPELLFKQWTLHGGRCSCFDVTTIFHLPLSRRQICATKHRREGNKLSYYFSSLNYFKDTNKQLIICIKIYYHIVVPVINWSWLKWRPPITCSIIIMHHVHSARKFGYR